MKWPPDPIEKQLEQLEAYRRNCPMVRAVFQLGEELGWSQECILRACLLGVHEVYETLLQENSRLRNLVPKRILKDNKIFRYDAPDEAVPIEVIK